MPFTDTPGRCRTGRASPNDQVLSLCGSGMDEAASAQPYRYHITLLQCKTLTPCSKGTWPRAAPFDERGMYSATKDTTEALG